MEVPSDSPLDVITFCGEKYVSVTELRRHISRHRRRTVDHGYVNALRWVESLLKEL